MVESVTGANGWLKPQDSYMQGLRALCDHYGILMICDEVMAGFGRTGKMFGFEHYPGVLPDLVTFAKGVTGAFIPLSGVASRQPIQDFFRKNPLGIGSTYFAHPVSLATAYATLQYTVENDIVGHVQKMEPIMKEEMAKLVATHPSAK
jgi:taurine--2-oxoglutarate transaminase